MEKIWILSSSGMYTGLDIPNDLKVLHIFDYSSEIYQNFNIEPIYQRFHYKGKQVWHIQNPNISQKKPLSLSSIESSPHLNLYIVLPSQDGQNSVQYPVSIHNPESKTLYHAFNLIRQMYKISNIFDTGNFMIYDHEQCFSINSPLSSLKNHQIFISNASITDYIKLKLVIEGQDDIEYHAQASLKASELISFIALKRGAMNLEPYKNRLTLSTSTSGIDKDVILGYAIQDNDEVIATIGPEGGAMVSMTFVDFEKPSEAVISDKAPKWRLVKKGFSFIFNCPNKDECDSKGEIVIASVGYGSFDLSRTIDTIKCPECGIKLKTPPKNCGYYNAKVNYVGHTQDGIKKGTLPPSVDKFLFYPDEFAIKWTSLTISCSKNKETR